MEMGVPLAAGPPVLLVKENYRALADPPRRTSGTLFWNPGELRTPVFLQYKMVNKTRIEFRVIAASMKDINNGLYLQTW